MEAINSVSYRGCALAILSKKRQSTNILSIISVFSQRFYSFSWSKKKFFLAISQYFLDVFSNFPQNFLNIIRIFSEYPFLDIRDSKERPIKKFVSCLPCDNPPCERYFEILFWFCLFLITSLSTESLFSLAGDKSNPCVGKFGAHCSIFWVIDLNFFVVSRGP